MAFKNSKKYIKVNYKMIDLEPRTDFFELFNITLDLLEFNSTISFFLIIWYINNKI